MEREDIAALHRKFIDKALRERSAALAVAALARNDLHRVVVAPGIDLPLAVEHRLQHRRAIARQDEDHSGLGLEFGGEHGRPRADVLAFAFDRLDRSFGGRDSFLGAVLIFEDRRMLVVGRIEHVEPGQFRLAQRRRFGSKPDQPFDEVVAGIGVEGRLDPGEALLGGERLGLLLHLRRGETFEQRDIGPGLAVIVVEQFTLDPAAGSEIGIAADEPGARVAAAHRAREHHAADRVRVRRIVAGGDLLEDPRLDLLVRGRAIGLGHVEGDLARGERLEHHRRERGEAQAAFDEAHGEAEAAGDLLDRGSGVDQRGEGLGFVGRVHREAMEVLGKAGLDCALGAVFEHQAGHFVVLGQKLVFGQRQHRRRRRSPASTSNLPLAAGRTMRFCSSPRAAMLALSSASAAGSAWRRTLRGRLNELVQRDRLDHRTYS